MSRAAFCICIVAISTALASCGKSPVASVLIDDWWNVDDAKNGCVIQAQDGAPCDGDPTIEVRSFEAQLDTFFASDPVCHGVIVSTYEGPNTAKAPPATVPQSTLMLDYNVGQRTQHWSLVAKNASYTEGTGDAKEITRMVCSIVTHVGGSIAN